MLKLTEKEKEEKMSSLKTSNNSFRVGKYLINVTPADIVPTNNKCCAIVWKTKLPDAFMLVSIRDGFHGLRLHNGADRFEYDETIITKDLYLSNWAPDDHPELIKI